MKTPQEVSARPVLHLLFTLLALTGCQEPGQGLNRQPDTRPAFEPLVAMETGPVYHVLDGYDPIWMERVREGIETARAYWGSYGPTHVWIAGSYEGAEIDPAAKRAFVEEYCGSCTFPNGMRLEDCAGYVESRFLDVAERDESEAYLSYLQDTTPPRADLVFINIHKWFFETDPVPDPTLRGIHEYTHVFQSSFGSTPTWMMEGGAVFAEAWLPVQLGWRGLHGVMERCMESARRVTDPSMSIADMEDVDSAPGKTIEYYRELAYDRGAWAVAFMIHTSPTRRVSALRDEFYPSVTELGWEAALSRFVGMQDKQEFYAAFESFMGWPLEEQLTLLDDLKD
ncbi:MAG TPA: hypothetical protein QF446_15620 [Planctomycetota bacterium]|jgi:hypothetical protein|nr:hypothetical protein [Planctomycetota bacterium]